MSKSPSLIALLGLLAVAGYQNRDKLGSLLGGLGGNRAGATPNAGGTDGGLLGNLGGLFGGGQGGAQGGIGGALSDLVDRFTGKGHGDVARSWVETGPNRETSPSEIEDSLGSDVIDALAAKTGLPRGELLDRLSSVLPVAVDTLTPDGRIPANTDPNRSFVNA